MTTVISVEHLSKTYRLGQIGTWTFAHDLNVWWARMRGKPNPMLRIGESTLQDYPGTVLLVSHDRAFLDNVVTQTLAAEGDGTWHEYVGGYSDWLRQRPSRPPSPVSTSGPARANAEDRAATRPSSSAKLTYKESRELEALPATIESLEREQQDLTRRMSQADYHKQGAARLKTDGLRLAAIAEQLAAAFERWAELEARVTTS